MNYYEIRRALKPGVNLTVAQRSSSLFAEEPTVMGIVLRRGLPPMKITEEQFERNKISLIRLESAGAIEIIKMSSSEPVKVVVEGEPLVPEKPAPVETKPEVKPEEPVAPAPAPVEPVAPVTEPVAAPVETAPVTEVKVEEKVEVKVEDKKLKPSKASKSKE